MSELHADARLLLETAQHVEGLAYDYVPGDLESDLIALALLDEANRALAAARTELADRLAGAFPKDDKGRTEKRVTVEGVGTFEWHSGKKRTKWDREALLSAVLDSRMADASTGEFFDETPLDKVLAVWNLGAPRTTVLALRGIDGDQFCETEQGKRTIQLTANAPTSESEAA